MQPKIVICPKCRMKNRIPIDRLVRDARCGNCQESLENWPGVMAWGRGLFWTLCFFCSLVGLWRNVYEPKKQSSDAGLPRPTSSSLRPSIPTYKAQLDRLTPLLNNESVNPFSEKDFLWFIYESDEWLRSRSYLNDEDQVGAREVLVEFLTQRNEFTEFNDLFQLGKAANAVKAEIESEKRQLERDFQATRNQQQFTSGFNSGFEGGQIGATAFSQGASGKEALLVAAGYTALSTFVRLYQDEQALDANKRQALERLAERSHNRLDEIAVKERALRQRIRSDVSVEVVGGEAKGIVRRDVEEAIRLIDQSGQQLTFEEFSNRSVKSAQNLLNLWDRSEKRHQFRSDGESHLEGGFCSVLPCVSFESHF